MKTTLVALALFASTAVAQTPTACKSAYHAAALTLGGLQEGRIDSVVNGFRYDVAQADIALTNGDIPALCTSDLLASANSVPATTALIVTKMGRVTNVDWLNIMAIVSKVYAATPARN